MFDFKKLFVAFAGSDRRLQRQVGYWMATVLLYMLWAGILWFQVKIGVTSVKPAIWLTAIVMFGVVFFSGLVRASNYLGLSPAQLAIGQGSFAIGCATFIYIIAPPIRGAVLTILPVVVVFCVFALKPRQSLLLGAGAILLFGATSLWLAVMNPQQFDPRQELVHFILAASALAAAASITGQINHLRTRLKLQKAELTEALIRIETLATRDELTSLANRRHMNEILCNEERRHRTSDYPISLALLDIDWFKQINDTYGHAAGDEVLRAFAAHAQAAVRATDMVARWGGEEFLLLFPNTTTAEAAVVIERLKSRVEALHLPHMGADIRFTFSAGLVGLQPRQPMNEAIRLADIAMYRAKSDGRNRIVMH
jgi:diguanylate cyclase (GGDEF)-like protein